MKPDMNRRRVVISMAGALLAGSTQRQGSPQGPSTHWTFRLTMTTT